MPPLPIDDTEMFKPEMIDGPVFDASVHLQLEMPVYVERLGVFAREPPSTVARVTGNAGSSLAFTAPFRLLSDAGVAAMREILAVHTAKKTHRSYQHRGLYHTSPFVRAMCTNASLLAFFSELVGEPVQPHHLLMDAAFANEARADDEAVVAGTADPWHFDSCTCVDYDDR